MYCTVLTGDYSECNVTKTPCEGDWKERYLRRVGGSERERQAGVRHRGRVLLVEKRPDSLLGCAGQLALTRRVGAVACSMASATPGAGMSPMTQGVGSSLVESLADFVGGPGSTFAARKRRLAYGKRRDLRGGSNGAESDHGGQIGVKRAQGQIGRFSQRSKTIGVRHCRLKVVSLTEEGHV